MVESAAIGVSEDSVSNGVCGHEVSVAVNEQDNSEEIHAEEETEPRHTLTTPTLPSAEEVQLHRIDHIPFRPWCDECVEGQGHERGHFTVKHGRTIPDVSFDYFVLSKSGASSRHEWGPTEGQLGQKVLLVKHNPGNGKRF